VSKKRERESIRVAEVLGRLEENFPAATCALVHENAFQLLVATILSAQCTDVRVNQVTPALFERFPDPESMARADIQELEELIRSTGFFRNKAKSLLAASVKMAEEFGGQVPSTMDELTSLPGVARKTANVVLGTWFGIADGVVVDTHVKRIANRLGITDQKAPDKVEQDLMQRIPREHWIDFSHRLIHFGRQTCKSQRPRCEECFLVDLCLYYSEVT
jgi:endonuclease-3